VAIERGQVAQTLAFTVEDQPYVLRFNADNMDANFEKEDFIARYFVVKEVPIPAMVRYGRLGELHFCITEKAEGQCMDQLTQEQAEQAAPAIVAVLGAIHATDVSAYEGYGIFDGVGQGLFPSWPAYLLAVRDEERADGFFGKWHSLFETSFLERDTFDQVSSHMERLLEYCTNERYLVHGGFGFGNLLMHNGIVTGVIDWLDAKYGDFLYDVAWLDFWAPEQGYPERFHTSYSNRGVDVRALHERIQCYQCYIALDAMRFFAKADNPDSYAFVKDRVEAITA